jgi:2-keto-4-pentenoate hydratase/2-oxohepta-3-ene-1,7-dioic acid hydratase in catechol pathway
MRLVTIRPGGGDGAASHDCCVAVALESGRVLPLAALARIAGWPLSDALGQLSLAELLAADPDLGPIREAVAHAEPKALEAVATPPGQFRLGPPIPRPGKAIGVGYNYLEHIREQGLEQPARPVLFSMFANAVIGDGDPIRHPAGTHALDLEAELAVVMGRRASRVAAADALRCVAGYTVANDVTARDWQGQAKALRPGEKGDGQWLRAKGSDTFLPLGPALVTADELGDGRGLAVRSWVTLASDPGAEPFQMQDGNTADLVLGVAELISLISAEVALDPGDVIVTGTPSGVGVFREPPLFLQPGDLVRVEVERIGSLTNPITDEDGRAPDGSPAARFMAEPASEGEAQ